MKLVFSIVHREDAPILAKTLSQEGFASTSLPSTGGFLNRENTTLLVGVDPEKLQQVLSVIRTCCHHRTQTVPASTEPPFYPPFAMETVVGGATVFVVDIEHFERI